MLRQVIDRQNTGSEVWADSAYRSQSNEAWLADRLLTSSIHRRKPKGKSMPNATARANAAKSSIRARIEHVFAHQKNRFGLFIRTIGIARPEAKLTLAKLAYNFDRLIFHEKLFAACIHKTAEAAWVGDDFEIVAPQSLLALVNHLAGYQLCSCPQPKKRTSLAGLPDLSEVRGQ